ncbi:MAG: glutathione S-transferase [Solirubrobacteraceae bacterium]|jgi:glutathione S-transferase|nr:glutathione S-transferase [Solirubrobacteraceae bacterium]
MATRHTLPAVPSQAPRLITIPISHYCEKARWALERAGLPYREEPHLQAIHWAHVWRAGRGRTAPVLVTEEVVLTESADILRWVDARSELRLYPPGAAALEAHFDDELGPHGRRWMYHRILARPDLVRAYGATGVPRWERAALPPFLPLVKRVINRYLDVDDVTAAESRERVRAVFDEVGERLADGRRYLVGDSFTAADLTFAALAASVLVPSRYGVPLPPVEVLPEPFAREVRAMREHPAGRFALRLYDQERPYTQRR